jgi:hypothetical protein
MRFRLAVDAFRGIMGTRLSDGPETDQAGVMWFIPCLDETVVETAEPAAVITGTCLVDARRAIGKSARGRTVSDVTDWARRRLDEPLAVELLVARVAMSE